MNVIIVLLWSDYKFSLKYNSISSKKSERPGSLCTFIKIGLQIVFYLL